MFVIEFIRYWKLKRIIDKIDKEENITENLSKLFGVNFKIDYVGRRYAVLNPRIQGISSDPVSGSSSQVYEFTENGMVDYSYIDRWCMDRIHAASMFIINRELLDIMGYSLEKIDDNENYLFILKPILFDDLKDSFRKMIKRTLIILPILIILGLIII